jgi:hypothetical protein
VPSAFGRASEPRPRFGLSYPRSTKKASSAGPTNVLPPPRNAEMSAEAGWARAGSPNASAAAAAATAPRTFWWSIVRRFMTGIRHRSGGRMEQLAHDRAGPYRQTCAPASVRLEGDAELVPFWVSHDDVVLRECL